MDPQSVLLSSNLSDIVAMSDSLRNSSELQGGSNTSSHNNSIKKNSLCSRPTPTYPDQHMQLVGIQPFNSQGSIQHPRQGVGPSLELFTRPSPFEQSAGPPSSGSYPPLTSMPPPQLGQRLPLFVELPAIQPLYHLALSAPSPQQLQEDIDVLQAQLHIRQFNASLYQARMEQERLLSMHLPNYNLNGNQQ